MRRSSSRTRSCSRTVSSQLLCSSVSWSPLPCCLGAREAEAATPPGAVRTAPVTEPEADVAIPMSVPGILAPPRELALCMAIRYSRDSPAPSRWIDPSSSGSSITATWPTARLRVTEPLGGGGGGGGGLGPGPVVPSPPHAGSASSSARRPNRAPTSNRAPTPDRAPGAPIAGRPAPDSGVLTRRFVIISGYKHRAAERSFDTAPVPPDSASVHSFAESADRRTDPAMPVGRSSPTSLQRVNPKCLQKFAPHWPAGAGRRGGRGLTTARSRPYSR